MDTIYVFIIFLQKKKSHQNKYNPIDSNLKNVINFNVDTYNLENTGREREEDTPPGGRVWLSSFSPHFLLHDPPLKLYKTHTIINIKQPNTHTHTHKFSLINLHFS